MSNCHTFDPLVTPFVDDQLADAERRAVEDHLRVCPSCHSRVAAERAVHHLLRARRTALSSHGAPDALYARCSTLAQGPEITESPKYEVGSTKYEDVRPPSLELRTSDVKLQGNAPRARARLVPYTLTASLIVIVGGAFLYQATVMSPRV